MHWFYLIYDITLNMTEQTLKHWYCCFILRSQPNGTWTVESMLCSLSYSMLSFTCHAGQVPAGQHSFRCTWCILWFVSPLQEDLDVMLCSNLAVDWSRIMLPHTQTADMYLASFVSWYVHVHWKIIPWLVAQLCPLSGLCLMHSVTYSTRVPSLVYGANNSSNCLPVCRSQHQVQNVAKEVSTNGQMKKKRYWSDWCRSRQGVMSLGTGFRGLRSANTYLAGTQNSKWAICEVLVMTHLV